VLIEAAILTPLLLLFVMGIIEYGLFFKNVSSASAAAAAGARTAVTQARNAGTGPTFSDSYYNQAFSSTQAAISAISNATPFEVIVYRADPATGRPCNTAYTSACGGSIAAGSAFDTCTECYIWDYSGGAWSLRGSGTPSWPANQQNACGTTAQTDYLGVYVYLRHNMVTGMFGTSQNIREKTVMRLEPVAISGGTACHP